MGVDRLFTLLNRDGNGTVEWRWALTALLALAKGTSKNKIGLLVHTFDDRGDGRLYQHEIYELLSCVCPSDADKNDICMAVDEEFRMHSLSFEAAVDLELVEEWTLMQYVVDGLDRLAEDLGPALDDDVQPITNLGRDLAEIQVNKLRSSGKCPHFDILSGILNVETLES